MTPPAWRRLALAGGQTLAYRELGPTQAPAWLALHGGPGSGAQPGLWRAFDLARQRVIAPDQRGSGRSRPRGGRAGQQLGVLIDDLERLRVALGLERWSVMGGSWGATLALHYAARHPEAVDALVLRGSFLGSRREVVRLWRRFWPRPAPTLAARSAPQSGLALHDMRPAHSGALLQQLSQLFRNGTIGANTRRTALAWQTMEQAAALHGARRAWLAAREPGARRELKSAWQALRPGLLRARLQRPGALPAGKIQPLWQKFRLQSHHLAHRCGLRPGQWRQALGSIAEAGIATTWIHGRFDAVCPPGNSLSSHQLLAGQGARSRLVLTAAGHLGTEPGNHRALLAALREGLPRD